MAITYTKDIPDFTTKVKQITDITELQTTVSQLSASLVTTQGDVTELETTVGQLSASMLDVQGDITTLAAAVTDLETTASKLKCKQVVFSLPSSVTIGGGQIGDLLVNYDLTTSTAVDEISQKQLTELFGNIQTWYGGVFVWSTGSVCACTNINVTNNGTTSIAVVNLSAASHTVVKIRIILFYE